MMIRSTLRAVATTMVVLGCIVAGPALRPASAQPVLCPGQSCDVTNGSGAMNAQAASINTIGVACATTASLSGTVSGLLAGTAVTLSNGTVQLPVTTNGPFAFAGTVSDGTAYAITVFTQPLGTFCTVANGSGTFSANVATNIAVTCN